MNDKYIEFVKNERKALMTIDHIDRDAIVAADDAIIMLQDSPVEFAIDDMACECNDSVRIARSLASKHEAAEHELAYAEFMKHIIRAIENMAGIVKPVRLSI